MHDRPRRASSDNGALLRRAPDVTTVPLPSRSMADRQAPDRNLALELVRVTEAAALAAARLMGRGDKNAADGARLRRCGSCSARSRWMASS